MKKDTLQQIDKELAVAAAALKIGNDGLARVCARRAAGAAIAYWLQNHPHESRGGDAMSRLRGLLADDSIPGTVREAAQRLTARSTEAFTSPSINPIDDSRIIIEYLLDDTPGDELI